MTFEEYVKENYPSLHVLIENTGDYSELYQALFPNYGAVANELDELNYAPFNYDNDPTLIEYNGGHIVMDIAQYIGENYFEHDMNERFTKMRNQYSPLISKIKMLMYRYKYKWHALYESMQLDSQYDPLDNVNEIYDETITRTPDLTYTDANSNTFGQKTTTNTNEYGAQSVETENEYGAQSTDTEMIHGAQNVETENIYGSQRTESETTYGNTSESQTDNIGARTDNKTMDFGDRDDSHTTRNSIYPYDNDSAESPTSKTVIDDSFDSYTNSESLEVGAQQNTSIKTTTSHTDNVETDIDSHTDTQTVDSASFTDSQSVESASYTDMQTVDSASYTDRLASVESQHVDSFSGTKTETGEEETVITRRRHGNIGVTTSGQLIEDFRKVHYFDLIAIMSNDIINEIFDMNFDS